MVFASSSRLMAQSELLSAPLAPVFSKSMDEARARARHFFRDVRASQPS